MRAIIGYYNQNLNRRFDVRDILEAVLIQRLDTYSLNTAVMLLYYFGKQRVGEKALITSLIQRLDAASKEELNTVNPH